MDGTTLSLEPERTEVLGVPVDAVNMATTLQLIREMLASDHTHPVLAVNPEKVIAAQQDPVLLRVLQQASLVIPDGIGVVIAARLLQGVPMERVAGSDLMPAICRLAAEEGHSVFFYGAKPGVASRAAELLQQRYPGLQVGGVQHGYVPDEEMGQLLETINSSGAGVLFVGLGSPRQEYWMNKYRERLKVKVCQGVGGSFDAVCGNPRRAPKLFLRLNLEWLYRLVTQPQRLTRQTALPRFAAQVLRRTLSRK